MAKIQGIHIKHPTFRSHSKLIHVEDNILKSDSIGQNFWPKPKILN